MGAAPDDDYHLASIWCAQGEREGVCVDPGVEPATLLVPAPVVQSAVCYAFKADVTADCQDEVLTSTELAGTQHINQIDGLYPGAYYTAMSVFVGQDVERSVTVMRLVNALLASLLLAAVLRLLPAGLAAGATLAVVVTFVPLGLSLVASTNPSSWSIIGIGTFWAFALAFLRRPSARDRRGILIGIAMVVAAGMAIAARVDSAAYVAITAVVVVTLAGWRASLQRPWRLGLVVVIALAGALTYLNRGQPLTGGDSTLGTADAGAGLLLTNLAYFPVLVQGVVGGWNLSWNDVLMPPLVPVVGVLILGALLYRGLQAPSRPHPRGGRHRGLGTRGRPDRLPAVAAARGGRGRAAPLRAAPADAGRGGRQCRAEAGTAAADAEGARRARGGRPVDQRGPGFCGPMRIGSSQGTTVGLFDPKVDPAWTNGVGIHAWLVVLATAAASVALVWGTVWLSRSPEPTRSLDGSSTTAPSA